MGQESRKDSAGQLISEPCCVTGASGAGGANAKMSSSFTSGPLSSWPLSPHGGASSVLSPSVWAFLQHGGLRMATLSTQKPEFMRQQQKATRPVKYRPWSLWKNSTVGPFCWSEPLLTTSPFRVAFPLKGEWPFTFQKSRWGGRETI